MTSDADGVDPASAVSASAYGSEMDSQATPRQNDRPTLSFYAKDDQLPAGGVEALTRRSDDDLRRLANEANQTS